MPELKHHRPGWAGSYWQPEHFTNSPLWDYKLCRCENNAGEYCPYCQEVEAFVTSKCNCSEKGGYMIHGKAVHEDGCPVVDQ